MKRLWLACAVALPLVSIAAAPAYADVKTREKNHAKIEGGLGRLFNMFGGKAAREGVVTTVAVKGDRKSTVVENSGRIVDLSEEKVYEIDVRNKTYRVKTFDELRREMREAQERAEKDAKENKEEGGAPAKEIEIDFDVKESGQRKQVAGYDAREVIMTITIREKGKALEDGGGLVLTSNSWHGPDIPELKEVTEFDLRYWQKLASGETGAVSAQQMAAILSLYPMFKPAIERLKQEEHKLKGAVLASTMTAETVKSKAQMAEQQTSGSGGGGGLTGMLARKIAKKDPPKQRALFLTLNHEVQEVSTSVAAQDLAIPSDFKEKK